MDDDKSKLFKGVSLRDESSFKTESNHDEDEEFLSNNIESDFYDDDDQIYEDYEDDDDNEELNYSQNSETKYEYNTEVEENDVNTNISSGEIKMFKKFPKKLLRTPKCAR
jgi:hypothetical protein